MFLEILSINPLIFDILEIVSPSFVCIDNRSSSADLLCLSISLLLSGHLKLLDNVKSPCGHVHTVQSNKYDIARGYIIR